MRCCPAVLCDLAGRWDMSCVPMTLARKAHGVAAVHGEVWAVGGYWWDWWDVDHS